MPQKGDEQLWGQREHCPRAGSTVLAVWPCSQLRVPPQEQVVMNLDSRLLVFPLYICCNFLYTSPEKRAGGTAAPEGTDQH